MVALTHWGKNILQEKRKDDKEKGKDKEKREKDGLSVSFKIFDVSDIEFLGTSKSTEKGDDLFLWFLFARSSPLQSC